MSKPTCDNCLYNSLVDNMLLSDGNYEYCRRYPQNIHGEYLKILNSYDWCGEHKPKEEADNNE